MRMSRVKPLTNSVTTFGKSKKNFDLCEFWTHFFTINCKTVNRTKSQFDETRVSVLYSINEILRSFLDYLMKRAFPLALKHGTQIYGLTIVWNLFHEFYSTFQCLPDTTVVVYYYNYK